MVRFRHTALSLLLFALAALSVVSCEEKPNEESARFIVNKQSGNSEFEMLPEGGQSQLFVESELEWGYKFHSGADWLTVTDTQVNSTSWMLTLSASENLKDNPRTAVLVFTAGTSRSYEVTVRQHPEDRILLVTVPGAYGVDGGDAVHNRSKNQISRFTNGDTFQFSLLYPAEVKAVSISVPSSLEAGQNVTVGYKVVEKDRTLVRKDYPDAVVLRIKEPYVWLKVSDSVFFIIKK